MIDLQLDFENKKIINVFVKRKNLILQRVILALQCWLGDWFLDDEVGLDYEIRLENTALLTSDINEIILSVEGVSSVQDTTIKVVYEGPNKTQAHLQIYSTVKLQDEDDIILNGLIPIVGEI